MPLIPGGVVLTGFVAPTDSLDTYPVVDPVWGVDGLRLWADAGERDAIPGARRRHGMVVFTRADLTYWRLLAPPWSGTPADWAVFAPGSGSGGEGARVVGETPGGDADGSNATFTTAFPFVPGTVELLVNGLDQRHGVDFTTAGTTTLLLSESPQPGDSLRVAYVKG